MSNKSENFGLELKKNNDEWWAYVHAETGTLHVKRYFCQEDIKEALNTICASIVISKFPADNRDDAIKYAKENVELSKQIKYDNLKKN